MELPKKISPERLKDTIVELRYKSEIPFEYLLGLIYKALNPVLVPAEKQQVALNLYNLPTINERRDVFQNQVIRLYVEEGRLIFNSNGVYRGWSTFLYHLKEVLLLLKTENLVGPISRIGLRYVSEFQEIQIFDQLIWDFDYRWFNAQNLNTSFRTEWMEEEDRIIVTLVNNAQRENSSYSLMDVDVNHSFAPSVSTSEILQTLERLHEKEKTVFFGLLKPAFLTLLNPIY